MAAVAQVGAHVPLAKIASGGMATVFVARAPSGELRAIKRPHAHLVEDAAFLGELTREAAIAARIDHPNVARVHGLEGANEALVLVMNYVEGATLSELLAAAARGEAAFEAKVAVRVLLDACAGLHAVHELAGEDGAPLGLVHRDVSPQNLLVGRDGVTRVADFGLAKASQSKEASSTTGALKGKLGYLAPEYVRGLKQDRRADVFALGVVLWEALAKKRLFRGSNEAETIERVVHDDAPKLSSLDASLAPLDPIAQRALEKSPSNRFATALELHDALETAARAAGLVATNEEVGLAVDRAVGASLEARRRAVAEALRALDRPKRMRRVILASAAAIAVSAAIVGVFSHRAPPPSAPATTASAIEIATEAPVISAPPRIETPPPAMSASTSPRATASPSSRSRHAPEPPPNPYPR
jgi:serine/threonine-protein kinase